MISMLLKTGETPACTYNCPFVLDWEFRSHFWLLSYMCMSENCVKDKVLHRIIINSNSFKFKGEAWKNLGWGVGVPRI